MEPSDIQIYLDQMGRFPLLSREEELRLARIIKSGDPRSKEVQDARSLFLSSNLRLVVTIAKRYRQSPLSLADLIQEGNIGLMRALKKFDPDRGFKFSTYAAWWIRQAITRSSQQADPIRLSVYQAQLQNRVRHAERCLGLDATDERVASLADMSVAKVQEVRLTPRVGGSLDELLTPDSEDTHLDMLADEEAEDAEVMAILIDLHGQREALFQGMSDRTRLMFELRYGEEPLTLEEIGRRMGITRERVRQSIEKHKPILRKRALALGLW